MSNRYADDIKRIVGIDPNQSFLPAAEKRPQILAKRGLAYYVPGSGTSSKSGSPNETQLGNTNEDSLDSGENLDGQGPTDPHSPRNSISDGTLIDVEDLLDGTIAQSKTNSPQIQLEGVNYGKTGALNGLNVKDCATNNDVEIRLRNGMFPPGGGTTDSQGNELTPAWTDAENAPEVTGFTLGKYYDITGAGAPTNTVRAAGIAEAVSLFEDALNASASAPYKPYTFDYYASTFVRYKNSTGGGNSFPLTKASCTPGSSSYCPDTAPTEEYWPAGTTSQIKSDGAQFTTVPFDQDRPIENVNPSSKIDFCFGTGRTGSMEVTRDRGHMIYETSGGIQSGPAYIFNESGALIEVTDGTNVGGLNAYRPTSL